MIIIPAYDDRLHRRRILLVFALLLSFSAGAAAADYITGAVRNQSRGQAAAGDDVILLRLDQGMQEEARAMTDSGGAFTLKVQFPDKLHLVRVMHQGVNYDQRASAGDSLTIDVFDAAPKVQGVTGGIEIIRAGTKEKLLHVSDMIEIKNDSKPPLTQAGERTFEVYLPAEAKLDTVMAAGSGKIGVIISASPVSGEPGHYTVSFPLRPGSTKFAFNYDVPYVGRATFHPRLAYPLQQLAVMIPPTMRFSTPSTAFQLLATGNTDYQVQAASQLRAGDGPSFEISGAGAIPPLQGRAQAETSSRVPLLAAMPPGASPGAAVKNNDAGGAAPTPTVTSQARTWWILSTAAVLALGGCVFLFWRVRRRSASGVRVKARTGAAPGPRAAAPTAPLLEALKQELFDLETSRLEGSISREEYDAAKRALDRTVKRALMRAEAKS